MPNKTSIQWTDYTSNPILPKEGGWGCSKVSPGCDHCYAETLNKRFGNGRDFAGKWEFVLNRVELNKLLRLKGSYKIFIADMFDLFHSDIPWELTVEVFKVMASLPQHTFQVLTKRPGRMAYFANNIYEWPSNVWAGTSVESQKYAPRLECLLQVPALVRFVSAEPLLGPLNIKPYFFYCTCSVTPCMCKGVAIQQVIIGGESGPNARPMDLVWARDLIDQCDHLGVAVFMKQMGSAPTSGLSDTALWQELIDLSRQPDGVKLSDQLGSTFRRDMGSRRLGHYLKFRDSKGGKIEEWPEVFRRREFPCLKITSGTMV